MAKLIEAERMALEWSDLNNLPPKTPRSDPNNRSAGVHLSGILQPVMEAAGLLVAKERDPDEAPWAMFLGKAWEEQAVRLYPDLIWQPGEFQLDGVVGSPDGLTWDEQRECWILEEFKYTLTAMVPDILRFKKYLWQVAGYCKGLTDGEAAYGSVGYMRLARLHVMWAAGTYKPPSPIYMRYLIEFTEQELEQHWQNVILNNKHLAQPEKGSE